MGTAAQREHPMLGNKLYLGLMKSPLQALYIFAIHGGGWVFLPSDRNKNVSFVQDQIYEDCDADQNPNTSKATPVS
jgi:hypothetical protein